jgi:hypothetical protein
MQIRGQLPYITAGGSRKEQKENKQTSKQAQSLCPVPKEEAVVDG